MQNTLPLSVGHPLKNLTGMARQIALPGEHAPLRFPSFPALERTAVMGFNQPATLNLPAATDVAVTVFRQACYPLWADQSVPAFYGVDYYIPDDNVGSMVCSFPTSNAINGWTVGPRTASGQLVGYTGVTAAQTYPILAVDANLPGPPFIYVPAGARVMVTAGMGSGVVSTGSIEVSIALEIWVTPGESRSRIITVTIANTFSGGATSINPTTTGYWARPLSVTRSDPASGTSLGTTMISFAVATASSVSFSAGITNPGLWTVTGYGALATAIHMPLVIPSEFVASQLPWFATRTTAAGFLGTNVSQVLNKGGTVLGGRVSPAVVNAWDVTKTFISNLHPAEKAYLPLETGVYTYCPPSTDLVSFHDYTLNTAGGAAAAPLFILSNDSLYNKMYLTASGVAETLACTVSWHLEFRTSSALFQVGLSTLTLETLHTAQLVLAESGFFFENPEHTSVLQRVTAAVKKFAPMVANYALPGSGPLLGMMLRGGKSMKAKTGPSKPKATSAQGSGIVPKPKSQKRKKSKAPARRRK